VACRGVVQLGRLRAHDGVVGAVVEDQQPRAQVARYASLVLTGTYAAEYLRVGLVED
jgi:hypothetical protein